ncbi:hypothetical protein D3C80_1241490 [compost metagenome]
MWTNRWPRGLLSPTLPRRLERTDRAALGVVHDNLLASCSSRRKVVANVEVAVFDLKQFKRMSALLCPSLPRKALNGLVGLVDEQVEMFIQPLQVRRIKQLRKTGIGALQIKLVLTEDLPGLGMDFTTLGCIGRHFL